MMLYPRFTKVIIHYFLSKHNSIPKRHGSLINTIKDDGVLGRVKFVSKGEGEQLYGMSILDVMMIDDVKNSDAYQTYLASSTGTELPRKKGRKGKKATATLSKKGSITAEYNILPDLDEALQLELTRKADIGAVEHQKKKNMKEIASEPTVAQELLNLKKGTRAKVPNELKGSSATQANEDDWGSKGEIETLSSDDERTESDKEKAKSEIADEEVADEETSDKEIVYDEKDTKEITYTDKADEEMADAEKIDAEQTEEEKVNEKETGNDQAGKDDQTKNDQAKDDQAKDDQFLNVSFDISLAGIVKEPADTKINSMLDVPIQQEIPHVQQTPLLDVLVSVIPEQTTPTLTITEAQADPVPESDPSIIVFNLLELEKKVAELLERTVRDVLKNNPINLVQSSFTQADSLSRLELKKILLDKMQKSGSFLDHDKHLDLYNALMISIGLDEAIEKRELDSAKVLKQKRGDDEDQDPPTNTNKEKKMRRRKDVEPSKQSSTFKESPKGKTPPKTSKTGKSMNAEETVEEPIPKVAMDVEESILDDVTWFNNLVNAEKDSLTFNDLMATPINFTKFAMNCLKKDKITKADLVGHVYKLLKGTCKRNMERKYSTSITKTNASRYELEGIEDMIPRQWSPVNMAYDRNAKLGIYH
ncbi:hypothetical protein Tco_0853987 [Tanacetum coccineum]